MGQFNFFIPDELHKKFKVVSIERGIDMKDLLVDMVKKEVDKDV